MPNKLVWKDRSSGHEGYRIYRSTSFIPENALPAALATVGPQTLEYTDNAVARNVPYHYRVGVFKGNEESLSPDRVLAFMPYTGPGPQKLLRGTWENGYFGALSLGELFDVDEFAAATGIVGLGTLRYFATRWLKFVYKGKILFFPDASFMISVKASALYQLGLAYGTDDQSLWVDFLKTNYGIVPQNKKIQKGEEQFIVRFPRTRGVPMSETTVQPDSYRGNEIDVCFAAAFTNLAYGKLPDATPSVDDIVNPENATFITADNMSTRNANSMALRGGSGFDAIGGSIPWDNPNGNVGYRPVLELVM